MVDAVHRNPQNRRPKRVQLSSPAACQVATIGHFATASVETQIAGVIGSCMCRTSNCSSAKIRFSRKKRHLRGEHKVGSEPFAGTITVRPTGITSGGGSSWRRAAGGARA